MRIVCGAITTLLGVLLFASKPLCAAEKPTIKQIINRVQTYERRYDQIEMIVDYKYRYTKPVKPTSKVEPTQALRDRIRLVQANKMFYFERKRVSVLDQDEEKMAQSATKAAFDGKHTRILHSASKKYFAELHHSRHLHRQMLQPNSLLFWDWNLPQPLSRFLQIPDTDGTNYHWKVVGFEKLDGLKCIKLKLQSANSFDGKVSIDATFWLAVDRNYQPAKIVYFTPRFSMTLPHSVYRVSKFKEVNEGVWLPAKTEATGYDAETLLNKGKQRVAIRTSFTLRDAKLKPKVDKSLFQGAKFPKGTHVSEYRDGKIVKTYRQK